MDSRSPKTVAERSQFGKSLRKQAPRTSHAEWTAGSDRADPIDLIEAQNEQRVAWLVPERRRRMMASPFTFYRAAAQIMAADLAGTPVSGLTTQICGDAHLSNFGLYASPERHLVFDINDFDETLAGPWEWDLKRLATSFVIAARHNQLGSRESRTAAELVAQHYHAAMQDFAGMRTLEVWYAMMAEEDYIKLADSAGLEKRAKKTVAKAKRKDSSQALDRFAEHHDGTYQIKSEPPLLLPLRELAAEHRKVVSHQIVDEAYEAYKRTLPEHNQVLLSNYHPVDFALKVVGVGSVGTRCWILLLEGRDREDPQFLQMKEATDSVLAGFLKPSPYQNQGRRVVAGQSLMQTAHDAFLGWTHHPTADHDYYWRQLRDWKGALDVENLNQAALHTYARACAWTLARAHARAGDPVAICGYLGTSQTFALAVADFAELYADQNEQDFQRFLERVDSDRLEVAPDP